MKACVSSSICVPNALTVSSKAFTYRFFLSCCFFVLLLFSLTFHHSDVGIFILVLVNVLFCADILARCGWKDLMAGRLSFALFAGAAILAGFLYSAFNVFLTRPLYGPSPNLFVYVSFLLTLSLWAERRLVREKEQTRIYIKKLDDFLPKSGRLCVGHQFRKVFAGELKEGDLILVKQGERLPCDGIVKQGKTSIDEQLVTGNMLPTSKRVGSSVYAGTLNKSSSVYVEVTLPLSRSALMNVIDAVKKGELRRGNFASALDTFSAVLLPLALLLSLGVYAYILYRFGAFSAGLNEWFHYAGALLFCLALSCPPALVFAPIFPSFFARAGARAKKIKIQNIYALDELVRADTVFFDKTGTLTYGELRVSGVFPVKESLKKALLETVATAEQLVDGPFADAVNGYAKKHKIKTKSLLCFDVLPGLGVQASTRADKILAGRIQWIKEQGVAVPDELLSVEAAVICVVKNGEFLGYLTLADELRRGAREMVDFLKAKGKDIILVSGDNESSVSSFSKQAGIEKMNFNVLPKTKAEIITNLRGLGKRVVMVGDGFNDIIALLRADAGIVFASGRNVYNNWVDIILKRKDLYPLKDLFTINTRLRRTATLNAAASFLFGIALVVWLFWRMPDVSDWHWTMGGCLAVVFLLLLNSVRLLKIK